MAKRRGEVSQSELAKALDLSTRQIRNLEVEGLPHRAERNRKYYPLVEAMRWYFERRLELQAPTTFDEAKARKMSAEAELAELELARQRGQMVTVDDAERELALALSRLRAKLLNLPQKFAPQLVGLRSMAEVIPVLEAAIAEAMGSLAAAGDEDDDDLADAA